MGALIFIVAACARFGVVAYVCMPETPYPYSILRGGYRRDSERREDFVYDRAGCSIGIVAVRLHAGNASRRGCAMVK